MKKKWIPIVTAVVFLLAGCAAGVLMYSDALFGPKPLPAVVAKESTAEAVDYGYVGTPLITTASWYGDTDAVYTLLKEGQSQLKTAEASGAQIGEVIDAAITELGTYAKYYEYLDQICIELNGKKYGAYVEDGQDPIGGGAGYSEIFTTGDYVVSTAEELYQALRKAKEGEVVFIEGGAVIDLTNHLYERRLAFNIRTGVTLASNRGYVNPDGTVETGAVIRNESTVGSVFTLQGNARITGLVVEGPTFHAHLAHHARAFNAEWGYGSDYYYSNPLIKTHGITVGGNNAQIDNCELSGFGKGAIHLEKTFKDLWVHHCYIHHNQNNGLGYGITHDDSSESLVEYCLFNYNRHSIAATGAGQTGYIARYNIEMGESLAHCFDIHGGADRGEASNHAGDYCEMYNNTFLAEDHPYWLRGVPSEYQYFYQNNCLYPYDTYRKDKLEGENVSIYDNIFGIDEQTLVP